MSHQGRFGVCCSRTEGMKLQVFVIARHRLPRIAETPACPMVNEHPPLDRHEYIEQAYLFGLLANRIVQSTPIQEMLEQVHFQIAASTRLPMAIQYMLAELRHCGAMSPAMKQLAHYFAPFQTYLVAEAEREEGKFDMRVALKVLEAEAKYRSVPGTPEGLFFFQFEAICRNRLRYDPGLAAIYADPVYDEPWRRWIGRLRRDIGLVDLGDLIFLHSDEYRRQLAGAGQSLDGRGPFIFGAHEGRIAAASRRRDALHLFAALQRHLDYPAVPRPTPADRTLEFIPQIMKKLEQLEQRLKLLEQENRTGIDITRYYGDSS